MRRFLLILLCGISLPLYAELHYIEITAKQNMPLIVVKSIDDFELLIKEYNAGFAYVQCEQTAPEKNSVLIIADNTYFLFALEDYRTLKDYRAGNQIGYKTGSDYYKANSLGIDNPAVFYFYTRNKFDSVADCMTAYKNGFAYKDNQELDNTVINRIWNRIRQRDYNHVESGAFYHARENNLKSFDVYVEYLDYTDKGYKNKADMQKAANLGFAKADEFYASQEAGFSNYDEYQEAEKAGLRTKADYTQYLSILADWEKIQADKNIDRKFAVTYYYLQKLPKTEQSLAVLSQTLKGLFATHSESLQQALAKRAETGNAHYSSDFAVSELFSESNLELFFKTVSIDKIGSYSTQSGIFKRK